MHEAFVFAHTLIADSFDGARVWLPWSSELFYGVWGLLEWRLLTHVDASFSEYLFGLKRNVLAPVPRTALQSTTPVTELTFRPLSQRHRILSWISIIIYPYLKRILRQKYDKLTAGTPDAELERQSIERRYPSAVWLHWLMVHVYPVLHVVCEGSSFLFLIAFMLGKTPFFSLWQQLSRLVLKRATRRDQLAAQANPLARNTVMVTQMILAATVLGFRLLEWRRAPQQAVGGVAVDGTSTSAEPIVPRLDVEAAAAAVPGAPRITPGTCPVCSHRVTNAAVNTVSGVVCCYPCLQQVVAERGVCPVTNQPTISQNIRRLYEA
ncbi:peroxisome assembly protein (Pex2/Pex12), putative [Bodo saltans]|uniref:Peroxisome assembly protein (Pex2/Pex12), putative n=1 Tax=Bodo saltans TaxID=75058 RepID=A0A0S4IWJ0_BODSA|nr:peroxisome assembly protein (Pex2/Pex12), putative [Bodo saltans]|eukprot:CUG05684.1 peroxisome assembly protein (Pex2/Pex12), putative [Bodo saltans]